VDEVFRAGEVTFVWHREKALRNARKHGVSFMEAVETFFDRFVLYLGEEIVDDEPRERLLGMTETWQLLYVVYIFGDERVRIISARAPTNTERTQYEDQ
jgi:uncharacterized protein